MLYMQSEEELHCLQGYGDFLLERWDVRRVYDVLGGFPPFSTSHGGLLLFVPIGSSLFSNYDVIYMIITRCPYVYDV